MDNGSFLDIALYWQCGWRFYYGLTADTKQKKELYDNLFHYWSSS